MNKEIRNSIFNLPEGGSSGSSWMPQTLVVEDAAPTNIVLTSDKEDTSLVAGDFTIAGFTVDSLSRDVTNKILTLTLSNPVYYVDVLNVVIKGKSYSITNNVAISDLKFNTVTEGHSFIPTGSQLTTFIKEGIRSKYYYSFGIGGNVVADVISRAAAVDATLKSASDVYRNVLALYIGTNDMNDTVGCGTITYNALKPYLQARSAAGWELLVYTCTPSIRINKTAQFEIERNVFNNLLKTDASLINHVYILDTDLIHALDNPLDIIYYPDGLHATSYGYYLLSLLFFDKCKILYTDAALYIKTGVDLTLMSTGNGTGVSKQILKVSSNISVTLDGNGYFYTDAAGTLAQSQTWNVVSGADRTMYIKVTSGSSMMKFSDISKVTKFSEPNKASYPDEKSIAGDFTNYTSLTYLEVRGNNYLLCNVANLTSLTYLTAWGKNYFSGSVANLTSLTYLQIAGFNSIFDSLSGLTSLTSLMGAGYNFLSGDLNPIVSNLTYCILSTCGMIDYTAGATWGNATITINPAIGVGYGYSATEIDNMLIDMAASVALIGKTITLKGSNAARTAASNTAVATLTGAGRTNTVLTN